MNKETTRLWIGLRYLALVPLIALGILSILATGGGGGGDGSPLPPGPMLDVTLEEANGASETVTSAGGTVAVTASDGTHYTLTIPPGAVLGDQEVTISVVPVSAIEGLPVSGQFLAAVQLGPEGLILFRPATLTIDFPVPVPADAIVGFFYAGSGESLAFYPIYPQDLDLGGLSMSLEIYHFSGFGGATGSSEDIANNTLATQNAEFYSQQIAEVLKEAAENIGVGGLPPDALAKIREILLEWRELFTLDMANAPNLDILKSAAHEFMRWRAQILRVYGSESDFAFEIGVEIATIRGKINQFIEELNTKCLNEPDLCSRGKFIDDLTDLLQSAQELLDSLSISGAPEPDFNTFCDGLINKLPQTPPGGDKAVTVEPAEATVRFGDSFGLNAVFRNRLGDKLSLSTDILSALSFQWSANPAASAQLADSGSNPLIGKAVGDGPIIVTAQACGNSDSATIDVTIDLTGIWSGSGSESSSGCEDPEDNGTFPGSGQITVTQDGLDISGSVSVSSTTFSGTVQPGLNGGFTVSGSFSGVEEGTPFGGTFNGTGSVNGSAGTVALTWSGADFGDDTCVFTGSGSATRN